MTAANEYPRDRTLRVGDKERDAVSAILQQALAEGRLDDDEFQERLDRCLRAKTYADLDGLVADFPREETNVGPARRRPHRRPWPVPFMFLPLAVIAAIAVGGHVGWFLVPLLFFFVVRPLMWRRAWGCGPRWRGPLP